MIEINWNILIIQITFMIILIVSTNKKTNNLILINVLTIL